MSESDEVVWRAEGESEEHPKNSAILQVRQHEGLTTSKCALRGAIRHPE